MIENPLMGSYHLAAMLGFLIYAKNYKEKGTQLFFRVHDLYLDNVEYRKSFEKLFSGSEIREIFKAQGVDRFLIINHSLKKKLARLGVNPEKIFYLFNGINQELFNQNLNQEQIKEIKKKFEEFVLNSLKGYNKFI